MTLPSFHELQAPPDWACVEFISDLHLQPSEPHNFTCWQAYMAKTQADAVFILGDLFEAWIGDDCIVPGSFEAQCVEVMRQAGAKRSVNIMHGNRDFLMGSTLMAQCGAKLLPDPTVLCFQQQRYLLSHGDALCLDDEAYVQARRQMRHPAVQQGLLAKPLEERQQLAQHMRQQSKAHQQTMLAHTDLDTHATVQWLHAASASSMIHGHTHRPANHDLGQGLRRIVLSDWDARATPPRAQVLRLSQQGLQRILLDPV